MYLAPKGYSVVTDGWGIETREDTYTCAHCCKVCFVPARADPTKFFCRNCYAAICEQCQSLRTCEAWEKKMERVEKADAWLLQRFGEKYWTELERPQREAAAIEVSIRRQQFLKDMGL